MTRADGTLVISDGVALVAFERRLHHPIEAIWAALTEPGELGAWLGTGTLEAQTGGEVSIRVGPEEHPERQRVISGRVLECRPPRVLEYEWVQPGVDISVVRYELEPVGNETLLKFTHRRSATEAATGGRAGWHAYLDRLAAHLDGEVVPSWSRRRAEIERDYGEAPLPRG